MREFKTEADCRILYSEIVRGYSVAPNLFIRHSTELDFADTEILRRSFLQEGEKQGLLSEQEKLDLLDLHGHWTKQEELDYKNHCDELSSLKISAKNLYIPQQIQHINKLIEDKNKEINAKFKERAKLLGATKETYASQRASEVHIFKHFFKDSALQIPSYTQEEIDNLSPEELNILIDNYQKINESFTEKNIKKVAACPFFINAYIGSGENSYAFWGKSMVELTIYQISLYNRGSYYKQILEDPKATRPPEEYYDDLDKAIKHYDQQYSLMISRAKNPQKNV